MHQGESGHGQNRICKSQKEHGKKHGKKMEKNAVNIEFFL